MIVAVYHPDQNGNAREPKFPATSQQPDAVRYLVGAYYVDAVGGEPSLSDVETFVGLGTTGTRTRLLPELRALRDKAMNVLDGLQADALASGDTATALAIRDAKQACRDIPALDVSAATSEAQMRALYLSEWRRIVALVPAGVRTAFAAVLS